MVWRSQTADSLALLKGELSNFQDIARYIMPLPGEIPTLSDIDVYRDTIPLNGVVGGDHIIYVDFKKRFDLKARIEQARAAGKADVVAKLERCKSKAGIVLLDVSGHLATDALIAAMLHQAFLLGSRTHHAAAVREPQYALLPLVEPAEVCNYDLRRNW